MNNQIFNFQGKYFLVTGASSGFGKATVILLSKYGAKLILVGRSKEKLEITYKNLSGNGHIIYPYNLENLDDSKNFFDELLDKQKKKFKISGLVCCAGLHEFTPLKFVNLNKLNKIFQINFFSSILLTKFYSLCEFCEKPGSIVFLSSVASESGSISLSVYGASKAALNSAAKSLALELADRRIRVNSVISGHVETGTGLKVKRMLPKKNYQELESEHPLGFGKPNDIANAILYLLGNSSNWVTGTSIVIDGGFLAK